MTGPDRERPADAAVFFHCPPHLLALGARFVERLLLREALDEERVEDHECPRIWVAGQPFAVWDLGLLLGLGPQSAAAVLLRLPWEGGTLGLALRTGPCAAVKRLPQLHPVPGAAFAHRPGALSLAFRASDALGDHAETPMGYVLDPSSLFTAAELAASAAVAGPGAVRGAAGPPRAGQGGP